MTIELNDKEIELVLNALGKAKSEFEEQHKFQESHSISNVMSKVRNAAISNYEKKMTIAV